MAPSSLFPDPYSLKSQQAQGDLDEHGAGEQEEQAVEPALDLGQLGLQRLEPRFDRSAEGGGGGRGGGLAAGGGAATSAFQRGVELGRADAVGGVCAVRRHDRRSFRWVSREAERQMWNP